MRKKQNDPPRRFVSWEEIGDLVHDLARRIPQGLYRGILGIPRGGLVPAAMLAYEMRLPISRVITPDNNCGSVISDPTLLIVDDISDTGKTLDLISNGRTAVLFATPEGRRRCTYYGAEHDRGTWLVFPWAPEVAVNRVVPLRKIA
jgi:xanthine phosphoribosyltransferase